MCLYGEGEHVCGCVHTTAHMCVLENNLQVHFSPSAMWVLSWIQVNRVYMTSVSTLCATSPTQKKSAEGHSEDLSKSLMVLSQEVCMRVFPTPRTSASGILSLAHCWDFPRFCSPSLISTVLEVCHSNILWLIYPQKSSLNNFFFFKKDVFILNMLWVFCLQDTSTKSLR